MQFQSLTKDREWTGGGAVAQTADAGGTSEQRKLRHAGQKRRAAEDPRARWHSAIFASVGLASG